MTYETTEIDGKVYRRQPWKGHAGAVALILIGNMVNEKDDSGKATGNQIFRPLMHGVESTNPQKASQKAAQKAQQKAVIKDPSKASGKATNKK